MSRITFHRTATGGVYRHVCARPGPKPLPEELKRWRVDVTLEPAAIRLGRAAAESAEVSFSEYVNRLIYADCMCIKSV